MIIEVGVKRRAVLRGSGRMQQHAAVSGLVDEPRTRAASLPNPLACEGKNSYNSVQRQPREWNVLNMTAPEPRSELYRERVYR